MKFELDWLAVLDLEKRMFTNVDSRRTTDSGCRRHWYTNSSPVSPWLTELIIKYIECINNMYPVLMHVILTIMYPTVKNIIKSLDYKQPYSLTFRLL